MHINSVKNDIYNLQLCYGDESISKALVHQGCEGSTTASLAVASAFRELIPNLQSIPLAYSSLQKQ